MAAKDSNSSAEAAMGSGTGFSFSSSPKQRNSERSTTTKLFLLFENFNFASHKVKASPGAVLDAPERRKYTHEAMITGPVVINYSLLSLN